MEIQVTVRLAIMLIERYVLQGRLAMCTCETPRMPCMAHGMYHVTTNPAPTAMAHGVNALRNVGTMRRFPICGRRARCMLWRRHLVTCCDIVRDVRGAWVHHIVCHDVTIQHDQRDRRLSRGGRGRRCIGRDHVARVFRQRGMCA